jgi:3-oxoacyl-[acyl-carrier protein] reductase
VSLAERVAIVTGASSGLGRASALALAEQGAAVIVAGLEPEGLEETAAMIRGSGGRAVAIEADISDSEAVAAMARRAEEEFGGTDILVNNAAIYPYGAWDTKEESEWQKVFAVNVTGYWLCAKAVKDQMIRRGGGSVVSISSITFFAGNANLMPYVASKGAVIGFTRVLAREGGPHGIRANAIAPGAFRGRATDIHPDQEKMWADTIEGQSIKREGDPRDVGNAVVFFASDASSFVTGQTLLVDGGTFLH